VKLYLVRHADAVDGEALADAHRWLSPEGRRVARAVGQRLHDEGVRVDLVLTSPLVRAVQTAELLVEAVGDPGMVEAAPWMQPGVPPQAAVEALRQRRLPGAVALVGHMPGISALGALLVTRPSFPGFRPGQVALVEDGAPVWQLHPGTLQLDRLLVA
jgi:phosphohistidine phosphatase